MRRRLLIALFALGTLGGYGSAIAGSPCRAHHRQAAWEQRSAHPCGEPARDAEDDPAYRP